MTAQEFINKHVKDGFQKRARVLALLKDGDGFWHVHANEELPKPEYRPVIAID